jgi:penicillin-binding protein 2
MVPIPIPRTDRTPPRPAGQRPPSVEVVASSRAELLLRLSILSALCFGGLLLVAARLWSLQVLHAPVYARAAALQAIRVVVQPGERGPIVDDRNRLLAGNDLMPVVTANPRRLGTIDAHGRWSPSFQGRRILGQVAALAHEPVPTLIARIRRGLLRSPLTDPVIVTPSRQLAFYLLERSGELPGISVQDTPVRSYPEGALGSEFLGLVSQISAAQLAQPSYRGYRAGDLIGQSGVEASYDRLLRGQTSVRQIVVDALGRPVGSLRAPARRFPAGLKLTIDARIQRAAERALRDGIALAHANGHLDAGGGAAVVMNPSNGAIYALASYPDFNQVAAARNPSYLASLLHSSSPGRPLVDRALQGLYPVGSTFKPIVAEAAMASGLISPDSVLQCTGALTVGNRVFHNVEAWVDAPLTLPEALAISCDTWFYRLGVGFYLDHSGALERWAHMFGIGRSPDIDIPGAASGQIPKPRYEGDLVNLSVGQGALLVSPLQLAVAYAAIANGGTIVRPHLAAAVLTPSGDVRRLLRFPPRAHLKLTGLQAIREGLYRAAHDANGTSAGVFAGFPVAVAGKTGTAEAPPGSDHSWYASYAPASHPRVVVVVLIEHGGFGAQAAAPAAREIYSAFFRVKGP